MHNINIIPDHGTSFTVERRAVAKINPQNCVNCGKCREICPVEAISEQQRVVCHVCPSCTVKPSLTVSDAIGMATMTSCTTKCPLGISPQGYINLVRAGKSEQAYQMIWEKNPLPSVCARICHHPCEDGCKRGILVDEPLAIRGIKRYLSDTISWKPAMYPRIYEEEIAIIGAGPAGLSAAHSLAMAGYGVTVFDAESEAGGMLNRGIPEFRLPRNVVAKEITALKDAGIKFRLGERINKIAMEELKVGFDAIIISTGTPNAKGLKLEGWRKEGVITALDYMERINSGADIKRHPGQGIKRDNKNVVVIGGGSVAIDVARTAVRMGARQVTAVCLESGDMVPCHAEELAEAREEGVELIEGYSPICFEGVHPELTGVRVAKVTKFDKDENGRITFSADENGTRLIPADLCIVAVGQASDQLWEEYENDDHVFFAGDVRSNACSVVDAIASGQKAAMAVDTLLGGREVKDPLELRLLHRAPDMEKVYPATLLKINRPARPILPVQNRIDNFKEVECEYVGDDIAVEVQRCMECGYQLVDISKCIGCGNCKLLCPKGNAITLVPIGEEDEE